MKITKVTYTTYKVYLSDTYSFDSRYIDKQIQHLADSVKITNSSDTKQAIKIATQLKNTKACSYKSISTTHHIEYYYGTEQCTLYELVGLAKLYVEQQIQYGAINILDFVYKELKDNENN